jgi:hypothetical protein
MLHPLILSGFRRILTTGAIGALCTVMLTPGALANADTKAAAKPKAGAKSKAGGEKFTCTQIMGVSVTGDWFGAGFEDGVDNKRFQAITRKHGFIEFWGDPENEIWKEPVVSPCAERSNDPDRVVFTGVNWKFKTVDEWTAALTKAVQVLKDRYKGLRRIELLTMLRAPGNKTCGNDMSVVNPAIDEAIAKVTAAHPDLVKPGPKIETPTCDVFTKGGPHYTPEGFTAVAKLYAAHYGGK